MDKEFFFNKKKIKKIITFLAINIFTFLYLILTIQGNLEQSTIRKLAEDPRTEGANEMCIDIEDYSLFKLHELQSQDINTSNNIRINFCKDIDNIKSQMIYNNNITLIRLAGSIHGEENSKNKIQAHDSDDEKERKVTMLLAAGDICKEDQRYKAEIVLLCDPSTFLNLKDFDFIPGQTCNIKIEGSSSEACGIHNKYWSDIEGLRITSGIVLLVGGIFLSIFGYNWLNIAIYLVCISGGLAAGFYVILIFGVEKIWIVIVILIIFLIIGILLAIFFTYKKDNKKYYMFLIGGLCGFAIGVILNNSIITLINTSKQGLIRIIIITILVVIGIILGYFLHKGICILGTSFIGSYGMMRGISLYLYKQVEFLNELKIIDLASTNNFEKIMELMSGWFYIYPIMLIIFTVATIIIQIKINPKYNDIDNYKDLDSAFDSTGNLPNFKGEDLRALSDASGVTPD